MEVSSPAKRRAVSVTFVLVVFAFGAIAYFAAPTVMTYIMLQQERVRATASPTAPQSFGERPEGLSLGSGGN